MSSSYRCVKSNWPTYIGVQIERLELKLFSVIKLHIIYTDKLLLCIIEHTGYVYNFISGNTFFTKCGNPIVLYCIVVVLCPLSTTAC